MTASAAAASTPEKAAAAAEPFIDVLNAIGRTILHYVNGTTFGLLALLVLIVMLVVRRKRRLPTHRSHCFRLAAGMLEIYLAVTLWTVFSLTHPPAFELLSHELLPYVGLVTLIVMLSSGLLSLRYAFSDNVKGPDPTEPPE